MHAADEGSALFERLLHAAALVEARLEEAVMPSGLSLAKFGVLAALVEAGEPLPLGQLAERIACVKSNVTQLVDRLEEDGLVRREPDPADRRVTRAAITEDGLARYRTAQAARSAEAARLSRAAPPALRPALTSFLGSIQGR